MITNREGLTEQELGTNSIQQQRILALPQSMTATAIQYMNGGLSVIPTNKEKKPALYAWKSFQSNRASINEISKWWGSNDYSIAIICGSVSDNLELIDFDEKHNLDSVPLFDRWQDLVNAQRPGLIDRLVKQTTINNGYHIVYRCLDDVEGNQKLAKRAATEIEVIKDPDIKSLTFIETRGEGGYFICYPSTGYSLCNGSLLAIPTITPDEREVLLSCARALNQYIEPRAIVAGKKSNSKGNLPGDVYNEKADHKQLLESHGWTYLSENCIQEYWRRPGKKEGMSASFLKEKNLFYVFTSNASPLDSEKAYNKFALYTFLESNGDFKEAAKKLAQVGYGELPNNGDDNSILLQRVEAYLMAKYNLRRNSVTTYTELCEKTGNTYGQLENRELNSLQRELVLQKLPIGIDALNRLLDSNFVEEYDPIVSYLEKAPSWDGTTDHIGILAKSVTLLNRLHSNEFRNNLERWLIGMVACAIEPNAINQTAIILVGPQGIGKSRWLNRLVPSELSKYQYIGNIDPTNKDALGYLSECILINLDELETLRKAEIGALKSMMTLQSIKVRRPYDRLSQNLIRRASFVGSINQTEFLNDPTGSRRFLTFECESFDFDSIPDIDKVLAQAYTLYKNGERWWFDQAEIAEINERNKNFTICGHEEELLLEFLPKPIIGQEKEWLTATKIADRIRSLRAEFRVDNIVVRNLG